MSNITEFIKDYQVILLIVFIIGSVSAISVYGIQEGLDLKGGSLIQLHLDQPVDKDTMSTVTNVLDKRLNSLGVSDVKVRGSGSQDVITEIAGVQPDKVSKVIGTPGKFEAKIGNQTIITGSDIVHVNPYKVIGNSGIVPLEISVDSAKKFATAVKGKPNIPVDMYLDDKLLYSPNVDAELTNGAAQTQVEIKLPASSKEDATKQANDMEAVLQSGALPVKVQIVGVQGISPDLGSQFEKGALIAGLLAVIMVSLVVFLRYRKPILVIPIIFTTLSELIIILGVASVIHWNIDLPAIAGILAAIGTGVDDQIIITDEVMNKKEKKLNGKINKRKKYDAKIRINIKAAFFIIFASAATLIAAMMPLAYYGFSRGYTGIGMLSAFAFTTILGVLIGIFITRPVYAKFIEKFL